MIGTDIAELVPINIVLRSPLTSKGRDRTSRGFNRFSVENILETGRRHFLPKSSPGHILTGIRPLHPCQAATLFQAVPVCAVCLEGGPTLEGGPPWKGFPAGGPDKRTSS